MGRARGLSLPRSIIRTCVLLLSPTTQPTPPPSAPKPTPPTPPSPARRARARQLEQTDHGRYLHLDWTPDERFLRLDGRLPPDEGALVMAALDRLVPSGVPWQSVDAHRAASLVALSRTSVARDADP